MNYFHALIFGMVEGFSEFLPISSTAHLMLTAHLLKLPQTNFLKSFQIAIQLGAILSVVVLYWRSFLINFEELKRVICAFIPTGIIGFGLYKLIKKYFMDDLNIVLAALFLGGIVLILFEKFHRPQGEAPSGVAQISYRKAFLIGVFQSFAVVPGVSRSAATIIGGVLLGVERRTVVEFSFLLAVPTMAAATTLDLLKNAGSFSSDQFGFLAVGFLASFFVALLCIKGLLAFIKKFSFVSFGIYRILIAILFWIFLMRS